MKATLSQTSQLDFLCTVHKWMRSTVSQLDFLCTSAEITAVVLYHVLYLDRPLRTSFLSESVPARRLQPQNSSSAAEISRKLALHGDEKIAYMNGTYLSETNHLITEPIYLK